MPTKAQQEMSRIYVELIRVLFAVVLGLSFTLILRSTADGGYREWFADPSANFEGIWAIFLTYTLVISSFVGYHKSTRFRPILKPWRFILDIGLLFLYFTAFVLAADLLVLFLVYVIIFSLYLVWNIVRVFEYKFERALIKKALVVLGFLGLFLAGYFIFLWQAELIPGLGLLLGSLFIAIFIGQQYYQSLIRGDSPSSED